MRMLLLLGAILLIVIASFQGGDFSNDWFAVQKIEIKGDLVHVTEDELQSDFSPLMGTNLLNIPLSKVLEIVLSSEWVANAEIRKIWPNTLQVLVYEHAPLAYWGDRQLISTSAVIITPQKVPTLPLTKFYGPDDTSDVVLEQFSLISQVLSSTSLRVATLSLEERGAWRIIFTNGVTVKLGREDILERLQRFIAVYKSDLSGRIETIISVDARYPHGVAVSWEKNN